MGAMAEVIIRGLGFVKTDRSSLLGAGAWEVFLGERTWELIR
jgi:hypothetical protein